MKPFSEKELVRYYRTLSDLEKTNISTQLKNGDGFSVLKSSAKRLNLTHKVIGKLFFEYDDMDGLPKPIHNIEVEIWDRDVTNPDDFLGSSKTELDGSFEIFYDPQDAGKMDQPDLELRIFETRHKFYKDGNVRERNRMIYSILGSDNVTQEIYDFGPCKIPYWEYDPNTHTPRVLITDEGEAPQGYAAGRSLKMVKVLTAVELKKRIHLAQSKRISINEIQNDYPENLTLKMEKEKPGSSRSDDFFVDCLLNGMSANIFDRDPINPEVYWIHYHWNSYEQDGVYALPNIDIKLKLEEGKFKPTEITVALRKKGMKEPNSPLEKTTAKRDDGDKWEQAKRIARVSATLIAELDMHLCATHLNAEQYAIPAYRNIRENPVRYLLFPHIKEVCLINHSANQLLLGKNGYVTRATGLTEKSIAQRIKQVLGTLDWNNWKPREILIKDHVHAKASNLYWEVLNEFIDWFFKFYNEGIRNHWDEIKLFSDELVAHSVPAFMCGYLRQTVHTHDTVSEPKANDNKDSWYQWNERLDLRIPRPVLNNEPKAISRITTSNTASETDMANLKQMCAYVIHHTTFAHWWSNSRQYDEGGELRFTGLGLRYGDQGIFTPESDDSILPPAEDATMQLWISYMLSNSSYGFILKNEEKDIHPKFLEILKKRKEEFLKLGVNIEDIPSRTNI